MPNFANIAIAGHMGSDPDLKTIGSGTTICEFSVAVNTGFGDRKVTTWYRVTLFGKRAESAANNLAKGQAVIINGTPYIDEWNDKDGNTRQTLKITADNWTFGGAANPVANPAAANNAPAPAAADPDDDIPF